MSLSHSASRRGSYFGQVTIRWKGSGTSALVLVSIVNTLTASWIPSISAVPVPQAQPSLVVAV